MTEDLIEALMPRILERLAIERPWKENFLDPSPETYVRTGGEFMAYSSCSASDFLHPRFAEICEAIERPLIFHRKLWEWAFIVHHLAGDVKQGSKGIVFGVGAEHLPAVFAEQGAFITATDAPSSIVPEWNGGAQHASGLLSLPSGKLSREEFERLVEWRECDMKAIPAEMSGYDFCWSSCCLEHLGSLQAGLEFIRNSVENVLKVGGLAVHTTELNLSSDRDTVESGDCVLYRRRDFVAFIHEMRARGHEAMEFKVAPDSLVVDGYVDTPPFSSPHLKLKLEGYTATSAGFVIRRCQ